MPGNVFHLHIPTPALQVLDDGRLTDSHGRTVDFRNTIIIMTSNLGSESINQEAFGFQKQSQEDAESTRARMNVEEALEKQFRPEFLNRLDEFIIFDSLTQDDIKLIVDKFMGEVAGRVADLIVFWHTQPGRKLRGLVALLQRGKTVWFDADKGLIIDDSLSDFDALEKGGAGC